MSAPADVLAVMDASGSLLRLRVAKCNTAVNKEVRAGREPHPVLLHKQDRAVYLLESHNAARAAMAELIEGMRKIQAQAQRGVRNYSSGHLCCEDIEEIADAALARVGGAS